jgi:glutamate N-acetyltransferase/amino-acid N-acetyltransferase
LYQIIEGHINQPIGFKAGGMHAGIKKDKKDLAIVYTQTPATFACLFTTNVVKAAPVIWNQKILKEGNKVNSIVINSGNANACTGEQGKIDNKRMAEVAAEKFGCTPLEVLVASTGVIGVPLPIEIIAKGIQTLAPDITHQKSDGINAANAIMTTDTFSKEVCVTVNLSGKVVTISGMAKGSGMIHPNMATMLSFVTTDVAIDQPRCKIFLKRSTTILII